MTLVSKELAGEEMPPSCENATWEVYLAALHTIDVAQVNLGHTVVVAGDHEIDMAVKDLLRCVDLCRIVQVTRLTKDQSMRL